MKILLDTNICIYLIKKKPKQVLDRINEYAVGNIGLSSITVAELAFGVQKSQKREQNQDALMQFLATLEIAAFDARAATSYGIIRAQLEKRGTPIGSMDTLIAGHAASLGVTLITNNVKEFSRVPDLVVENWI